MCARLFNYVCHGTVIFLTTAAPPAAMFDTRGLIDINFEATHIAFFGLYG